jgi:hypothetical protein
MGLWMGVSPMGASRASCPDILGVVVVGRCGDGGSCANKLPAIEGPGAQRQQQRVW